MIFFCHLYIRKIYWYFAIGKRYWFVLQSIYESMNMDILHKYRILERTQSVWLFFEKRKSRSRRRRLPLSCPFVEREWASKVHSIITAVPLYSQLIVTIGIDQADQKSEEQKIAEEYQTWKQSVPDLYDLMVEKATTWPSLTCQWLPNAKTYGLTCYAREKVDAK